MNGPVHTLSMSSKVKSEDTRHGVSKRKIEDTNPSYSIYMENNIG